MIRSGAEDPKGSGGVLGRVFDKDGKPLDEVRGHGGWEFDLVSSQNSGEVHFV